MMRKGIVLLIAVMLGLASSIGIYMYLQSNEDAEVFKEMAKVVVAVKDIQPKERITINQLAIKEFPQEMVHFESASSVDQVVGLFARDQILIGEQILKPRLIRGFEDYGIVVKISPGFRAMAIPVDEVKGVAGFIRPGDYVDIIAGFDEMTMGENMAKRILQKVFVLATDQILDEDNRTPQENTTVTVAVPQEEVSSLALALDHGVVRLVLRPIENHFEQPEEKVVLNEVMKDDKEEPIQKPTQKPPTKSKSGLSQLTTTPKPKAESQTSSATASQKEKSVKVEEVKEDKQLVKEDESKKSYVVEVIRGTERTLVTVEDD